MRYYERDISSGVLVGAPRGMWKNPLKYIGRWCEFKFMERDRQNGYRHPTFYRIREAK